jgi:pyrimidine operon attenuation protein/uracil phosphoribosyltransferase
MSNMTIVDTDTEAALQALTHCLQDHLSSNSIQSPVMLGIHTGGAWVATELQQAIDPEISLGTLDISFYRDDFSRIGMNQQVRPSDIPFEVDDKHIILVDDVLYTGRTIRAALNEIFAYGRPASVILVVLIERDGRQLPVSADCVGNRVTLDDHQQIKLSGPEPLKLEIIEVS